MAKIKLSRDFKTRNIFLILSGLLAIHLGLQLITRFIDWPEMLYIPWMMSMGMHLYRELWDPYTPLGLIILNLIYNVLGYSLTSYRVLAIGINLIIDAVLFFVSLKLFKNQLMAGLTTLFYIVWCILCDGNSLWYEALFLPFLLLAYVFLSTYIYSKKPRDVFIAGLFIGVAILVKQTAVWALIAALTVVIFEFKNNLKQMLSVFGLIMFWPVILYLMFALYFFTQGVLPQFLNWSFIYIFFYQSHDPAYILIPSLSDILFITPAFAFLIILIFLRLTGHTSSKFNKQLFLSCAFTTALILASLPRWGLFRIRGALAFAAIAFGFSLINLKIKSMKKIPKRILYLMIILTLIFTVKSIYKFTVQKNPRASSFYTENVANLAFRVKIATHGQPFFIFGNYYYLFYYLKQKPYITPVYEQFPWMLEIPGVQETTVASLEKTRVGYVVYIPYHTNSRLYQNYYPKLLGDYIFSRYDKIGLLPGGWLLKRK